MALSLNRERRQHPRLQFDRRLTVLVECADARKAVPGRCSNLSMDGVGAVLAHELPPGERVLIEFLAGAGEEAVRLPARVAYCHELNLGFQFVELDRSQTVDLERLVGMFFCSQMG